MKTFTIRNINDDIDQSLVDTLALMKRFEDTGMDTVMEDDYRALYDIYQRLQAQKQATPLTSSKKHADPVLKGVMSH